MTNYKVKTLLFFTAFMTVTNHSTGMDMTLAARNAKRPHSDTPTINPRPTKKQTLNTNLLNSTYVNNDIPKTNHFNPSLQRNIPPVKHITPEITPPVTVPPSIIPPFIAPISPWDMDAELHKKWNHNVVNSSVNIKNALVELPKKIERCKAQIEEDALKINRFDINGNHYSEIITDTAVILYLTIFPYIEYVKLLNLPGITNQSLGLLSTLPNLKALVIENCPQISEIALQNIIHLDHLSCVAIRNCFSLAQKFQNEFSENDLKVLKTSLGRHLAFDADFKSNIKKVVSSIYPLTVSDLQDTKLKGAKVLDCKTSLEKKYHNIFKSNNYHRNIILSPVKIYLKGIIQNHPGVNTEGLKPSNIANNTLLNIISVFPNITTLKLNDTFTTDIALWHVMKLQNLKYLDTRGTQMSEEFQLEYVSKFQILRLFSYLSLRSNFDNPANEKHQDSFCDSFLKLT